MRRYIKRKLLGEYPDYPDPAVAGVLIVAELLFVALLIALVMSHGGA